MGPIKNLKAYFNWSTGKDASLALYYLQKSDKYQVDRLVTSINMHHDRVSMHGLRREMLIAQAKEIGLPVTTIELPEQPTMEVYNKEMQNTITNLKRKGYSHCGFGDIFLEDLRAFRENQLQPYGIKCHFPLWKKNTKKLIEEFLSLGFKAIIIAINAEVLDPSFVGRTIDENFLKDLPSNVDPCGEHGEFHTFCYDGPIFANPIGFILGEKVYREYKKPEKKETSSHGNSIGFWFVDLILVTQ